MHTILVSREAEYQAVWCECKLGMVGDGVGQVQVMPIAIGSSAFSEQLTRLLQTGTILKVSRVVVMGLCGSLSSEYRAGDGVVYRAWVSGASLTVCDPALTATLKDCSLPGTWKLLKPSRKCQNLGGCLASDLAPLLAALL